MRRAISGVALATLLLVGACSGDDDSANPGTSTSTTSSTSTSTTSSSTPNASTTQPPATDVEAVTPALQELMDRYDSAVAAILTDPRVASNPDSDEVQAYLALFTGSSSFADGALASWAREGEAGRFYRPGPRGELTDSTVTEVTPASEDEASFTVCAVNSMEITDSAGNVIESVGGQTAATVVAVRVERVWQLRDLTEASTTGCPERESEE